LNADVLFLDLADRLRLFAYSKTDVFIIVYSVVNPTSYRNVRAKWHPDISRYCSATPCILVGMVILICFLVRDDVGTKLDLREDPATLEKLETRREVPVSRQQGEQLALDVSAVCDPFSWFRLEFLLTKRLLTLNALH
jgi:Ras-related C3 botulinum toxin substrate 1